MGQGQEERKVPSTVLPPSLSLTNLGLVQLQLQAPDASPVHVSSSPARASSSPALVSSLARALSSSLVPFSSSPGLLQVRLRARGANPVPRWVHVSNPVQVLQSVSSSAAARLPLVQVHGASLAQPTVSSLQ